MNKYKVKSGDLNTEIRAVNERMAAMKAIEQHNAALGLLTQVLKKGDKIKDATYFNTESLLNWMDLPLQKK